MKKILMTTMILSFLLCGCNHKYGVNIVDNIDNADNIDNIVETVELNLHDAMENKSLIYSGNLSRHCLKNSVSNGVLYTFDEMPKGKLYVSGVFKYDNYVVNLSTIDAGYYYLGKDHKHSFELHVIDNQLQYRLVDDCELIINNIYLENA